MKSRYKTTMVKFVPGVDPEPDPQEPFGGKWKVVSTETQDPDPAGNVLLIWTWERIGPDDYLTQD